MNWADAKTYCAQLRLASGSWRLPEKSEASGAPRIVTRAIDRRTSAFSWSSTHAGGRLAVPCRLVRLLRRRLPELLRRKGYLPRPLRALNGRFPRPRAPPSTRRPSPAARRAPSPRTTPLTTGSQPSPMEAGARAQRPAPLPYVRDKRSSRTRDGQPRGRRRAPPQGSELFLSSASSATRPRPTAGRGCRGRAPSRSATSLPRWTSARPTFRSTLGGQIVKLRKRSGLHGRAVLGCRE